MDWVSLYLEGFGLSAGLIVAIGAQNAFVLRLGLQRHFVLPAVLFCAGSDAVLMIAGGIGLGRVIEENPGALTLVGLFGAAFLTAYGIFAARRALSPHHLIAGAEDRRPLGQTLALLATFTWANPHVYLDTVLLVGSLAGRTPLPERWWFLAGACCASLTWFCALGFGARLLAPLFAHARAWAVLDGAIALTMWSLAFGIARETLIG